MTSDFSRQSFLGENSQDKIENALIGVIGLGGGGSHIIQQLAHIGFLNYVIYDPQRIDASNLNRLIGATQKDVNKQAKKVEIAKRVIKNIRPSSKNQSF